MKLPQRWLGLLLVLVCLTAICVDLAEAGKGRRKRKKNRKAKKDACKYVRDGVSWSACDEATDLMTKVLPLTEGSGPDCPPTRSKTKPCKKGKRKGNGKKGCRYNKQPWSECNLETKQKQREMILVKGDPALCLPKKIVTKNCKKACRYTKGGWGDCDKTTNLKHRTLTPKKEGQADCETKIQSRRCYKRPKWVPPNKCRYKVKPWSNCDPRSNTMTQMMTLKNGDPNVCQRSKKLTKKCKIACKFKKGEWSECNERTQLSKRVDTLIKGDPRHCDANREITKKCKKLCKYTFGDWGECDPATNERTRVKKLIKGDPDKCKDEDTVSRPCSKKDGGERCFFGAWGDFGPCTNGVVSKHRPVLQGGVDCERKAVITKACDEAR